MTFCYLAWEAMMVLRLKLSHDYFEHLLPIDSHRIQSTAWRALFLQINTSDYLEQQLTVQNWYLLTTTGGKQPYSLEPFWKVLIYLKLNLFRLRSKEGYEN